MVFEDLKQNINGKVHFVGIGGIGMSALAFLLNKIGVTVQGSDINKTYVTEKLEAENVKVFPTQIAENIANDITLVVKTSIIRDNNPEIIAAKAKNIQIITRAQLLAMIMQEKKSLTIAGTHGKTSTTALLATIFAESGSDPIIINGGFINSIKSNFKMGSGQYLVAESDESDGSFVDLPSFAGAVTNIEPEHLDFYRGDFELQKSYFKRYISQIPDQGVCAVNVEDQNIQKIIQSLPGQQNIVTYSCDSAVAADFLAKNIKLSNQGATFDVDYQGGEFIKDLFLPAFGAHNVSNSLAAIAIASHCQLSADQIKSALAKYQGVKRRFTKVGEFNGCAIIDDYAHHPTEIRAAINCAKQFAGAGQVAIVLQPHKYSRVQDLFAEFCSCIEAADKVFLCDIYAASQGPIAGISKESLAAAMQKNHNDVVMLENDQDLPFQIKDFAQSGNIILCAGAGTITKYASELQGRLQQL